MRLFNWRDARDRLLTYRVCAAMFGVMSLIALAATFVQAPEWARLLASAAGLLCASLAGHAHASAQWEALFIRLSAEPRESAYRGSQPWLQ